MDCPVCKITLQMSDRQGVEIDYCGKCRGIWLDRGELEKLIELSNSNSANASRSTMRSGRDNYDEDVRNYSDERSKRPKKKESWLGELFDFG